MVETLRAGIVAKEILVDGKPPRCSAELSPERRQLCAAFFQATEELEKKVEKNKWEPCPRTLTIYRLPDYEVAGELPRGASRWLWKPDVLLSMGWDVSTAAPRNEESLG